MKKSELVQYVCERTGMSRSKAEASLNLFFHYIKTSVKNGGKFTFPCFGCFLLKHRKARYVRNFYAEKPIHVKPFKTVWFRAASALKQAI